MARNRRIAAAVAVGTALALGVGAGGSLASRDGAPAAKRATKGPIRLTMWWWGEQEAKGAKKWLAQTVALYHKSHPDVSIKTVLQTTDGLVPTFRSAAAARKGPDIQYFWGGIWSLEDAFRGHTKAVSDFIPRSELKHYLNTAEDTFDGKIWTAGWYVQPSFPVLYRKDVLRKAGVAVPRTWPQLLSACDRLNQKGITPLAGGLKDGFFGGWLYALLGAQNIKSVGDVLKAVVGKKHFTDPDQAAWWQRLADLRSPQCFNKDINSLQLYQGQQLWADGKAAMTITAGSDVKKFILQGGVKRVGVMAMPRWAKGPYAGKLGSTSQTLGITGWTKNPQAAADFIKFTHTPARLASFFKMTGAFPADDRFDTKLIKLPQQKVLFNLVKHGAPYLENFIPTELDTKANFGQTQLLMAGNIKAKQAAEATERIARRIRLTQRDLINNFFAKWAEQFK